MRLNLLLAVTACHWPAGGGSAVDPFPGATVTGVADGGDGMTDCDDGGVELVEPDPAHLVAELDDAEPPVGPDLRRPLDVVSRAPVERAGVGARREHAPGDRRPILAMQRGRSLADDTVDPPPRG